MIPLLNLFFINENSQTQMNPPTAETIAATVMRGVTVNNLIIAADASSVDAGGVIMLNQLLP